MFILIEITFVLGFQVFILVFWSQNEFVLFINRKTIAAF